MNNTQKLQVATDALKRVYLKALSLYLSQADMTRAEELKSDVLGVFAILAAPSTEQPAAASADGLTRYRLYYDDSKVVEEADPDGAYVAHTDAVAFGARQREAGHHAAWGHVGDAIDRVAKERDDLRAKLEQATTAKFAAVQNGAQLARPADLAWPIIEISGCTFNGVNADGSPVFEYAVDGLIKTLKSISMIGWTCTGPREAGPEMVRLIDTGEGVIPGPHG